jgi:hypothetical protein
LDAESATAPSSVEHFVSSAESRVAIELPIGTTIRNARTPGAPGRGGPGYSGPAFGYPSLRRIGH